MTDHLKIKLSIANRIYPLNIVKDQEEGLRRAAQKIDQMIKQFEQSYSVRDKQDVLAMCALQFASQIEQQDIDKSGLDDSLKDRLLEIDQQLKAHLDSNVL
jgi:cell division protein ZapA